VGVRKSLVKISYLKKDFFSLKNIKTQNLKNISLKFPSYGLVSVCGPSGSGKTSLITYTLYPLLEKILNEKSTKEDEKKISLSPQKIKEKFSKVHLVSQEALGRSTRSNLATYLGAFDLIRKIFANCERAKTHKLKAGAFSFNVSGGRCETCKGLGFLTEELSFLGETKVICPTCQGKRFEDKVLEVTYKGKNLLEVLSLTVFEARSHFYEEKKLCKIFDACLEMGLSYLTLGQNTSSFSGGETQRLKLLSALSAKETDLQEIFIFDEPTVGLSDKDVKNFIKTS
jgi:Excinuclease ATPase subunit